jgi:hypothetical protein
VSLPVEASRFASQNASVAAAANGFESYGRYPIFSSITPIDQGLAIGYTSCQVSGIRDDRSLIPDFLMPDP